MLQRLTDIRVHEDKGDEAVLAESLRNPECFALIVRRYEAALFRKALRIVRSVEDAEEVVQDTFTKAYIAAPRFEAREGATVSSWLYAILMNTARSRYQKLKRERARSVDLEEGVLSAFPDKEDRHHAHELSEYVVSMLAMLPDHLAQALRLHVLEGRPQEEVAELEDISVGAVKTRIHRARKLCRILADKIL